MIRPILQHPDPRLREVSAPVVTFGTEDLYALAQDLFDTFEHHKAAGLAAVQIGVMLRVLAMVHHPLGGKVSILCNPEVVSESGFQVGLEGCLSFGSIQERLRAPAAVRGRAWDLDGKLLEFQLVAFPARVFAHEVDHLNARTMLDRMGKGRALALERKLAMRTRLGQTAPYPDRLRAR